MLRGMSTGNPLPRSPELMSRADTGLLVVDVQEKLMALIPGRRRIEWNIRRLIDAAKALGLPLAATEQYPQGLGGTVAELAALLPPIPAKNEFSCGACPAIFEEFESRGVHKLLVCGIEAHVCIQQTVFDVLAAGLRAYIPVDAVASRSELDREVALRRMDSAGATLTTTEAALFEWCQTSAAPEFKQISRLVRETPPTD
jgi:nicotinamidase-related amidase